MLAALAASAALPCAAAGDARWYLQVDNDLFFGTDRWYSSGVRLARVAPRGEGEIEWGVVHEVYTPEAKRYQPGVIDRAPAARLLASVALHERSREVFQTLELAAGVGGPSARGEQATRAVHHLVSAPEVDWSRQAGDRADVQAIVARTHRFDRFGLHYGASAGSQLAFAHVGGDIRFGDALGWDSPLLRHAATPPPPASARGWSAFIGASGRGVARNALLDRGYGAFDGPPARERWVGRGVVGVAGAGAWGGVMFTLAAESREFEQQRQPQAFGSVTLHVAF